ncbi:MAG: hypothetical protein CL897_02515 [Dehalococcoidia bacterium]|nr:hypothetical protein [Dehalococcoidia bacterium]|tara:strand:- start:1847 stop:2653 length:807 start_codon:yes stop_codon:yes gene_type:complete
MSRLSRALGFGDGDKRPRPVAESPKVQRIRETMRWRGYDLSAYTDEQITAVSSRFPNDISDEGETTEDGRRALAAALEQGDFAPSQAEPVSEEPVLSVPTSSEQTEVPPQSEEAERDSAAAGASRHRSSLGMPTLVERLAHIFGAHAWRPLDDEDGKRMQCVGCGQMRNEPIPFRAPPPPPPPPREEPLSRSDSPPSPLDDLPNLGNSDETKAPPQRAQGPSSQQGPNSPWDFFMGLPWWSKLLAIFIAIQVVVIIISAIGGGGGGGG